FRHDDADPSQLVCGRALVARLVGLQARALPLDGLRYDLRYYSGGIGVLDRLHIALPCAPLCVDAVVAGLGLLTIEAIMADDAQREEIAWLVSGDDEPSSLAAAAVSFIDEQRAEIQPKPNEQARIWFAPESGVNTWSLVYEQDGEL